MRRLLAIPSAYKLFGKAIGGVRGRILLVNEYLRPKTGDRILDIGCGEANILDYLPDVEYVGFDTSQAYIAAATKRYGKKAKFHCRKVTRDSVEIGTFDIAIAFGILHHLTDAEAHDLFEVALRALNDTGRLVTLDGCFLTTQSRIARYLLKADRGKFVRTPDQYLALARQTFPVVKSEIRENLISIPYSHFIMECAKA